MALQKVPRILVPPYNIERDSYMVFRPFDSSNMREQTKASSDVRSGKHQALERHLSEILPGQAP